MYIIICVTTCKDKKKLKRNLNLWISIVKPIKSSNFILEKALCFVYIVITLENLLCYVLSKKSDSKFGILARKFKSCTASG